MIVYQLHVLNTTCSLYYVGHLFVRFIGNESEVSSMVGVKVTRINIRRFSLNHYASRLKYFLQSSNRLAQTEASTLKLSKKRLCPGLSRLYVFDAKR